MRAQLTPSLRDRLVTWHPGLSDADVQRRPSAPDHLHLVCGPAVLHLRVQAIAGLQGVTITGGPSLRSLDLRDLAGRCCLTIVDAPALEHLWTAPLRQIRRHLTLCERTGSPAGLSIVGSISDLHLGALHCTAAAEPDDLRVDAASGPVVHWGSILVAPVDRVVAEQHDLVVGRCGEDDARLWGTPTGWVSRPPSPLRGRWAHDGRRWSAALMGTPALHTVSLQGALRQLHLQDMTGLQRLEGSWVDLARVSMAASLRVVHASGLALEVSGMAGRSLRLAGLWTRARLLDAPALTSVEGAPVYQVEVDGCPRLEESGIQVRHETVTGCIRGRRWGRVEPELPPWLAMHRVLAAEGGPSMDAVMHWARQTWAGAWSLEVFFSQALMDTSPGWMMDALRTLRRQMACGRGPRYGRHVWADARNTSDPDVMHLGELALLLLAEARGAVPASQVDALLAHTPPGMRMWTLAQASFHVGLEWRRRWCEGTTLLGVPGVRGHDGTALPPLIVVGTKDLPVWCEYAAEDVGGEELPWLHAWARAMVTLAPGLPQRLAALRAAAAADLRAACPAEGQAATQGVDRLAGLDREEEGAFMRRTLALLARWVDRMPELAPWRASLVQSLLDLACHLDEVDLLCALMVQPDADTLARSIRLRDARWSDGGRWVPRPGRDRQAMAEKLMRLWMDPTVREPHLVVEGGPPHQPPPGTFEGLGRPLPEARYQPDGHGGGTGAG
jgi:hypothetical protein